MCGNDNIPTTVNIGEVQLHELAGIVKALELAISMFGQVQFLPLYERLGQQVEALNEEYGVEELRGVAEDQAQAARIEAEERLDALEAERAAEAVQQEGI